MVVSVLVLQRYPSTCLNVSLVKTIQVSPNHHDLYTFLY